MKVEQLNWECLMDCRCGLELHIDGERAVSFYEGEPEDMSLGRNLSDVYKIHALLKKAHAAGAAGEPFEFTEGTVDE